MTAFGSYDESYPPEILRGYTPPLVGGAARRTSTSSTTRTLTLAPGEPGTYTPELVPADRPRNVTELRERARVSDPTPWPAGAYVLIGTSGKRAHWDGDDWHSGESPGYTEPGVRDDDELDAEPEPDEPDAEPDETAAEEAQSAADAAADRDS